MPKFKTLDLVVTINPQGNYRTLHGRVDVTGVWPSRPKGRRLFTSEQIRVIRSNASNGFTQREQADVFNCSHVSIYHIVNRSIYRDVV